MISGKGAKNTARAGCSATLGDKEKEKKKYKVPQEVMEQLLEVDQPNISLSVPVNGSYPCTKPYLRRQLQRQSKFCTV